MKTLLFILLVVFASCEKDESKQDPIDRTCWQCHTLYEANIPVYDKIYCDRTDIGLIGTGEISETEIRLFEKQRTQVNVQATKCWAKIEK